LIAGTIPTQIIFGMWSLFEKLKYTSPIHRLAL
jgi:hypothetical protein